MSTRTTTTARRHRPVKRAAYSARGSGKKVSRTVRVDTEAWYDARTRLEREEGLTISAAVSQFIEAYAAGKADLPRPRVVYDDQK